MAPETVTIAITCRDGSLQVMQFVTRQQRHGDDPGWTRKPTRANVNAEIAKSRIDAKTWRIVDPSEIPTDRTYRNAWRDGGKGKGITHHMPTVRQLHLDRIRRQRAPLLVQLDAEWMRATGQGNTAEAARIEAKRAALRALPETIAPELKAATTPAAVMAIQPL